MSEPEPFLILHRVRGEPAFDIATCVGQDGEGEELWIIPTSGHRAHPWWHFPLAQIGYLIENLGKPAPDNLVWCSMLDHDKRHHPLPDTWPDHYACNNPNTQPSESGTSLLARLGLAQKVERRF